MKRLLLADVQVDGYASLADIDLPFVRIITPGQRRTFCEVYIFSEQGPRESS